MNNNINNNNGKEVMKGQVVGNVTKENNPKPRNRKKKKNPISDDKGYPNESRKAPLTVHKNPSVLNKNAPKSQEIKVGELDDRTKADKTDNKKTYRSESSSASEDKRYSNNTSKLDSKDVSSATNDIKGNNSTISANLGKILLIIAIILLVIWAIISFM